MNICFCDSVNNDQEVWHHEKGKKRPTYFTIREEEGILWFIPLSSKIDKYKKIVDRKIKKYGKCDTILIRKITNRESAILIQIDRIKSIMDKELKETSYVHNQPFSISFSIFS